MQNLVKIDLAVAALRMREKTRFRVGFFCYRQHCAQRKPAGISFTQRPILRFFAPQGRIPRAIFTKFAEFVPHFRTRWVLKFGWICSRGYGVMGVLS